MRELKFRAWHKESKTMYWWDVRWGNTGQSGSGWIGMLQIGEVRKHSGMRDNRSQVDPDNCEIMQFTGLHDKNGVEIYEGSKLKNKQGKVFFIEWADNIDYCGFVTVDADGIRNLFLNKDFVNSEVIGNIHEEKQDE